MPNAAIGVRIGKMLQYIGSIKPTAPAIFDKHIHTTITDEYSLSQDNLDFSFSLYKRIISPDAVKTVASMP